MKEFVLLWLLLCIMILSHALTKEQSRGEYRNKRWHVMVFLTAWTVGVAAPIITLTDIIKKTWLKFKKRKEQLK